MSRTWNQWFDWEPIHEKARQLGVGWIVACKDIPKNLRHQGKGGRTCQCRKMFKAQISKVRRQEMEYEIRQQMTLE